MNLFIYFKKAAVKNNPWDFKVMKKISLTHKPIYKYLYKSVISVDHTKLQT